MVIEETGKDPLHVYDPRKMSVHVSTKNDCISRSDAPFCSQKAGSKTKTTLPVTFKPTAQTIETQNPLAFNKVTALAQEWRKKNTPKGSGLECCLALDNPSCLVKFHPFYASIVQSLDDPVSSILYPDAV